MFKTQHTKGVVLILLSALMFGSYGLWSRLIGDSFGIFYQGWTRALLITILLLPLLLYKKEIVPIKRKDWRWLFVFLIFTSLTQAPLFYAFNHMDIGTASLIFFAFMLLTMYAVGILFLGEKVTKIKAVTFLIAATGLFFTFSFSLVAFTILAAGAAVLNGVASGGEVSFSKKLSGSYSPLYLVWLSWGIIFVTNGVVSIGLGEVQHIPSFDIVWLYQIGYTIASIFGFWAIIAGLKYIEASVGRLIGLLEIVFSILFGILIFQEVLTAKVIVGAALILFAAALPHIADLRSNPTPAPA